MDICGNWFPTEMTAYLKGYPDFEFGYMPVPHINADKKDYAGNDSSRVRYSLDGNILAIPASSQYKEIAKDFLLSMYTKESYQSFVESNHGVLRPVNLEIDTETLSDFAKAHPWRLTDILRCSFHKTATRSAISSMRRATSPQ